MNTFGCPSDVKSGTEYKLQKKAINGIIYGFYWELGFLFAHIFKFLRFSPNFVSFLSLIAYVVMGFLFFNGHFLWGGLAFFIGILMDCTDGKLARITNNTSELGVWLDYNFDNIRPLFLYPPIAFALLESTGSKIFLYFAFIAVVANLIFMIINMKWASYDFGHKTKDDHVKKSKWHKILKQFYFYEGIEPIILIAFASIGYIGWYLIFWATGMAFMYAVLALYGGIIIARRDRNKIK